MATVAMQGASTTPAVGLPHAAIVFGWTLLGGAFGAFVGSFAGLAPPR
jgi:hypothetical protein